MCVMIKYGEKILLFFEVQSYSKFDREKFGPFRSSVVRSWVVRSWVFRSWDVRSWVVLSWFVRSSVVLSWVVRSSVVRSSVGESNIFIMLYNGLVHSGRSARYSGGEMRRSLDPPERKRKAASPPHRSQLARC